MFANPWLKKPVYVNRGISYGDYSDGVLLALLLLMALEIIAVGWLCK